MSRAEVFDHYCSASTKQVCAQCDEYYIEDKTKNCELLKIGPFSCWYIGNKPIKVVFSGRNTWIDQNVKKYYNIIEGSDFTDLTSVDVFSKSDNSYFNFIKGIIKKAGLEEADTCVSNLAKCNVTDDEDDYRDRTDAKYYDICVQNTFEKEINILKPEKTVLFTNFIYSDQIKKMKIGVIEPCDLGGNCLPLSVCSESICVPWWVRMYRYENGKIMYMLVTRHPGGGWKTGFKPLWQQKIVQWINEPQSVLAPLIT
jgi:hypothetical protein